MSTDSSEPQMSTYPQIDVHYRAGKCLWSAPRVIKAYLAHSSVAKTRPDTVDVATATGRFGQAS